MLPMALTRMVSALLPSTIESREKQSPVESHTVQQKVLALVRGEPRSLWSILDLDYSRLGPFCRWQH